MQVEFNKAAQSWTDSQLPSAQKKTALNRLFKVHWRILLGLVPHIVQCMLA